MGYTKQMASENRLARDVSSALLVRCGWSIAKERHLDNQGEDVSRYVRETIEAVALEIQRRYLPDTPIKRIKSQVARVMGQKRGKARRPENG